MTSDTDKLIAPTPKTWSRVELGQVADFVNGRAFKPEDWTMAGVPIVRIQNLNGGAAFNYFEGEVEPRYAVEPGDLLFSWSGTRGTSFGPHFWRGLSGVLNQHIFNVRSLRGVEQKYLYYALKLITVDVEKRAHGGTGIVHITKGQLEAFQIPKPPLSEQRKIATILSSVDDAIESTQAVIDQLQVVKKAMMAELLTRGLPGRHTRFKQTEIGEVPEAWEVAPVGNVGRVVTGSTPSTARVDYWGGRIPFITPGDLGESLYPVSVARTVTDAGAAAGRLLPIGTVLVTCIGSIGKCGLAPWPCLTNQQINSIVPRPGVSSSFLVHAVMHRVPALIGMAGKTTLPIVNKGTFEQFLLPLPPLDEQEVVGASLAAVDEAVATRRDELAGLSTLKAALMSVLLTGELRVTPDEAP